MQGKGDDRVNISASDKSILATVELLSKEKKVSKVGDGSKISGVKEGMARALRNISNEVGRSAVKDSDETVSLLTNIKMEEGPAVAQASLKQRLPSGASTGERGSIQTGPINGRPPEVHIPDGGRLCPKTQCTKTGFQWGE